jgi:hypothetical protein
MILSEAGLHFTREGDRWRWVEHPDLLMLRGERYRVGQQEFASVSLALADRHSPELVRGHPGAARSTRG